MMRYLLIPACAVLVGILPLPIDAYQAIRWIVFGTCIYSTYQLTKSPNRSDVVLILCAAIALIYNPISPFRFSRIMWIAIDIAVAAILIRMAMVATPTRSADSVDESIQMLGEKANDGADNLMKKILLAASSLIFMYIIVIFLMDS